MVKVAGVKFKTAGKIYYFDPEELEVQLGDSVIVETARGMEFGMVAMEITEVDESEVVTPLKRIIRIADEKDHLQHEENLKKKKMGHGSVPGEDRQARAGHEADRC